MIRRALHRGLEALGIVAFRRRFSPWGFDLFDDLDRLRAGRSPELLVDVGANVGDFSRRWLTRYPDSQVVAFEMIPDVAEICRRRLPRNVVCETLALGREAGEAQVHIQTRSVYNSLNPSVNRPNSSEGSVAVRIVRLDAYAAEKKLPPIDLLKIDTEGFELAVLEGASELLAAGRIDCILVEAGFFPENERNTPWLDLHPVLIERGYRLAGVYHQTRFHENPYLTFADLLYRRREILPQKD